MENLYLFIFLALLAEIVGTLGGFGSSMLFVPIASYFLDFYSVLGITALFHVSGNLVKIGFFREGIDKRLVLSIGIPAVIFVILGAIISRYIEPSVLEIALACFLITSSLFLLYYRNLNVKPTLINSVTGGTLSGVIAGMLGTGGAIRGAILSAYKLKKEVFIATSAVIDLGIDISRSVVYAGNGYVHQHDLYLVPILFIVSIAGTYIGKKILVFISEQQFRSMVLLLILFTGLITLIKVY